MELVRGIDGGGGTIGFVANGGGDERDIFHVEFDPAVESVVQVVVNAVAVIHNVDPIELDPLSGAIDPGMLDSLARQEDGEATISSEVTFTYEGLEITVDGDGHVWLTRNEPEE